MIYGLDRRVPIEDAPSTLATQVRIAHPSDRYRLWQKLDEQSRLQMVETALRPTNVLIDSYRLAL